MTRHTSSRPILGLLMEARRRGASDLHLVAGAMPLVRIDGSICSLDPTPLTAEDTYTLVSSVLTEHQLNTLQHKRDVEFSFADEHLGRCRVSAYIDRGSVSAAFRMIPDRVPTKESLGLPNIITDLALRPNGLVLITGPTGVGKTTTLNWMINHMNINRCWRIISIEDPVEFEHRHINSVVSQREVGSDCISFADALVRSLRQDPDVICVGEMRDLETISTVLTAAETGHLVISTLHTRSAASTVDRIVDVFPSHQQNQVRTQVSNVLQGVICQNLVPHSNNEGRVMAAEIMLPTPAIRNLIREGKTSLVYNAIATSRDHGCRTMEMSVRDLYDAGEVTWESALHAVNEPDIFLGLSTVRGKPPTPRRRKTD